MVRSKVAISYQTLAVERIISSIEKLIEIFDEDAPGMEEEFEGE